MDGYTALFLVFVLLVLMIFIPPLNWLGFLFIGLVLMAIGTMVRGAYQGIRRKFQA